jgi:SMI1-KNR4 cell-wall
MSATLETIWSVPVYLPYLQPALTDRLAKDAEATVGHRLPSAYLDILRVQNGGYIRYMLPEMCHSQIYGIGPHFPSITHFDWDDDREYVSFELDGLVPFDGDGHWHLCLDYRSGKTDPSITYIDVECDRESSIASDFSDYLRHLVLDVDQHAFVLPSVTDIEDVKSRLSRVMNITFEAPSSWAHGYPTHRAKCSDSDPEWISISPNLVPRGFVRQDDRRYEELCQMMPGQGKRYPSLPATSYIVSATDAVRSKLLDAFRSESIEIRPICDFLG